MTILTPNNYTLPNVKPGPREASLRDIAVAARQRLMNAGAPSIQPVQAKPKRAPTPIAPEPQKYRPIVKSILSIEEVDSPFRWRFIVDEVCAKHNVSKGQILGRQRAAHLVAARFEAYYRLAEETTLSLPQIGRLMGGKDHTSVLHGVRTHKARMEAAAG